MTPILVRPVREQLEHDRVIRLLQARWRRKYTVGINVGADQMAAVTVGDSTLYPDLVLTAAEARRPEIIVEVETGESVNNLEALAEWARLGQIRAEFHLYVPAGSVGPARRLCEEHKIPVVEICTYHHIGDEIRFSSAYKAPAPVRPAPRREAPAAPARTATPRRPAAGTSAARKTAGTRRTVKAAAAKRTRSKTVAKPARSQKRK